MTRRLSLLLGILLAIGAFAGVLLIGAVTNPSPQYVVVAITEIQPGTVLDRALFGIDPQRVSPRVAAEYVLRDELDRYTGATIMRQLVPGQPLMHRDLVHADNPAASRHVALALQDPDLVAMVLPVEGNVPDGIMPGDRIAVIWSLGEASFLAGVSELSTDQTGEGSFPVSPTLGTLPPELAELQGEGLPGSMVGGAREVVLPFAKTIVNVAKVIRVQREQQANPAYTGEAGQRPYIEGQVQALEIIASRDEVEAIRFAVANGEYSIVILSPNADVDALLRESTMGVMWTDILAFFQADRLRALGELEIDGPVRPAGASDIYGPVLAPTLRLTREVGISIPLTGTVVPAVSEATPPPQSSEEGTPAAVGMPAPLPTATSLPTAVPAPTVETTPTPEEMKVLELAGVSSLLLGIGCVVVVILAVLAAVFLGARALRQRKRTP